MRLLKLKAQLLVRSMNNNGSIKDFQTFMQDREKEIVEKKQKKNGSQNKVIYQVKPKKEQFNKQEYLLKYKQKSVNKSSSQTQYTISQSNSNKESNSIGKIPLKKAEMIESKSSEIARDHIVGVTSKNHVGKTDSYDILKAIGIV